MSGYIATINVPGYLPMSDDVDVFEAAEDAWQFLLEEYDSAADYLELTYEQRVRWEQDRDSIKFSRDRGLVDVVYVGTPGSDSEHDLGLAYSVTYDEDAEVNV